ncbi:regulatory protein GemA, partial [Desulfovibrio inopinatus]|uniref:regulatory protein GemA n=1 Tax=Desulfovibrio inopinatus TaxID=102109 RepID=UPI0006870217
MAANHRQALLAKVHIAKKDLGLADEDYRYLLEERYGVASAGILDGKQLAALVDYFVSCGWDDGSEERNRPRPGRATEKQVRAIRGLWAKHARKPDAKSLGKWLHRYWKVDKPEWLTVPLASEVIVALH